LGCRTSSDRNGAKAKRCEKTISYEEPEIPQRPWGLQDTSEKYRICQVENGEKGGGKNNGLQRAKTLPLYAPGKEAKIQQKKRGSSQGVQYNVPFETHLGE